MRRPTRICRVAVPGTEQSLFGVAILSGARIAQSFPDLTLGTFMKISGAPDGIAKVPGGLVH